VVTVGVPIGATKGEAFVIDASITARWIFADAALAGDDLLDTLLADGAIAPSLWLLEVANMTRSGERRGRLTADESRARLKEIARLPIAIEQTGLATAFEVAPAIAREQGLTVYDAIYLELAMRSQRRLATLDGELRTAAQKVGVALLP
jgi:predicted nucleic acid-binding protein